MELVALPLGKSPIGCRWIYTVKVEPNGQVDQLKARLVAKGYTQQYGITVLQSFKTQYPNVDLLSFLDLA